MGDRIEKAGILAAIVLTILADGQYCWQALTGAISPTLATWIVFGVGTSLSLASYRKYDKKRHSVISNISNHFDPAVVVVVATCVAISPRANTRFGPWDIACMALAVLAIIVWRVTHSEFYAYAIAQCVMIVGYGPLVSRLLREHRNTEPFLMWIASLVVAILFAVPPFRRDNGWAKVYAGRAIISVTSFLVLMAYLQFFGR